MTTYEDQTARSDRSTGVTSRDRLRQAVVVVSAVLGIIGAVIGSGAWGGEPVAEAAGGALSADATFLAPAGPAFSIWSVIYTALVVWTVWHTLPGRASSSLARATGWWGAASLLLNASWLLTVQVELLWLSVVIIVVLALVLGRLLTAPGATDDRAGEVITRVTFGLYLGWVSVATCANLAAVLVDAGVDSGRRVGEEIALVVLAAVCGLVLLYALRVGIARWAVTAAAVWGLSWIAVGRLTDQPDSTVVGIGALVAAVVSVGLTALGARRGRSRRGA
ncbi:tryptophan-rich sensory protein [Nocardioides daphniae]|uniref:Tryptophan-rich sensory protein n=1 Tax=Nocardioides daphniae TaxID=402297 RepID=A0A4P7UD18_9ACTN|nr:tryptophan-rich sensory protein [Nocardioides daphniae]QCC77198.1 tryptophan-rich sensory protein [Nocardioides daphniae]GGD26774.1 tryptophan-rich sensory protein [Nocardioides daphniae]